MSNLKTERWAVTLSHSVKKQYEKLKRNGSKKPTVNDALNLLVVEMIREGPYRANWSNYGVLSENELHCHLKRGRPTYVACWRVLDKKNKLIEVYYVGTHEGAPY